ncbi:hypothetical protein FPS14_contig00009-0040 [Flavobacterium psychrophilum]|nr:hypothetical protein FPS14_contig00009-0040 [Flavobacterium psychrophilum]
MVKQKNITVAEKQNIANEIDAKLRATLDYELIQKLIAKDIYKDLIN